MRLRRLSVQNFRNIALANLELTGSREFFCGGNGQGKTNLLEAASILSALRSFRTPEMRALIAHGAAEAAIAAEVEHEQLGPTRVTVRLRAREKEVWIDATRVTRLSEFLGKFPTVVFSSQDQQLVRGAPALRRRWLDLTLASVDAAYLRALQDYTRALAGRNALLKQAGGSRARGAPAGPGPAAGPSEDSAALPPAPVVGAGTSLPAQLTAFDRTLADQAARLVAARRAGIDALRAVVARQAARIAVAGLAEEGTAEGLEMSYAADDETTEADAWQRRFAERRARDLALGTTSAGPHRDDLDFALQGRGAREFASEGQQRSLVLALRLAQFAWLHERSGVRPVILADDVLGELDTGRRERFWSLLDPEAQVLATGTQRPAPASGQATGAWQWWEVHQGNFSRVNAGDSGPGAPA